MDSTIEKKDAGQITMNLKLYQVWLSEGRHVYMSKPLMQLELYLQVITFLNEYTFLSAAVKLVISDTLIEGASCWIHLLKMLLQMPYVQINAVYPSVVLFTLFWGKARAIKHTERGSERSGFQCAVHSKRESFLLSICCKELEFLSLHCQENKKRWWE